jgi:4-carboxymuconolactone decarboxylase
MTDKTMWRVPRQPREDYTDASREVQAFWGEPGAWENGSATNIIQIMANHPDLGKAYNVWGYHLLVTNTVPPKHRELIILRVGWLKKSEYEWHNHVGYALNLDMSLEEIAAIKEGAAGKWPWSDEDRAVLKGVDELIETNDLSDATWAELSRFYDRRQMMDYIHTIGHYVMIAWSINAMRMPLEDHVDQIGWDLKTRSGKTPQPTQKPGETEDWAENRGYDIAEPEAG